MTRNVCGIDRMIRILLGLALAGALGLGLVPDGIASIIAGIVPLVMLATALLGFCPAYRLIGLKPCQR